MAYGTKQVILRPMSIADLMHTTTKAATIAGVVIVVASVGLAVGSVNLILDAWRELTR